MRRLPGVFGWLSNRPIPDALMDDWFGALYSDPAIMRDLAGFVAPMSPRLTLDAAERLRTFPRPALMAWATEDRFFPFADGEKLARRAESCRSPTAARSRRSTSRMRPPRRPSPSCARPTRRGRRARAGDA